MQKVFIVLWSLLLTATPLWAEVVRLDPVVVTATRTATPLSQIGSSVTIITAEEIEAKQQTRVLDVLRSVPGVNILTFGTLGSASSISLRGTANRHTLVLIDGVEFRDAAGFGGATLAHLSTDNIEQIEIVRGAQSVLYGSDAIGGVINIITKKGAKKPEGFVSIEGGSYNTWIEKAGISASSETVSSSFAISRTDSDGFSAANEEDGNTENDGYKNTSASFNIGITPSNVFELKINLHLTDAEYEYDNYVFTPPTTYAYADADDIEDYKDITAHAEGIFHLFDNRWQVAIGTSITETKRTTIGTTFGANATYDGKLTKLNLQNTIKFGALHTLIVGAETEKEKYKSNTMSYTTYSNEDDNGTARNNAVFVQEQFINGNFSTVIGARFDDHENFGSKTTWRLAPTYKFAITGTRIKGSVGTGIKAPTLYEIYDSTYGNKNLTAEESFGWDIGIEQTLFEKSLIVGITYFDNNIDDYIAGDPATNISYNIKELKTKGVETAIEWYPLEILDMQLNYTYTDSKQEDGARKSRLPLHNGSFSLNLYPTEELQVTLSAIYTGERYDGSFSDETLENYTLVNLVTSYQFNNNFKIFGRVDNLFDKDYEEVAGYGTAGLSGYAGIKLSF